MILTLITWQERSLNFRSLIFKLQCLIILRKLLADPAFAAVFHSCVDIVWDTIICDLNKTPDLSQRPPQNYPKCRNPIDGQYCQGCALLRKKFKEDMFTYCIKNGIFQDFQDSSEPSNDNTNVFNALQEPFVVKQDLDENSSQSPPQINHHCCYGCGDSLEDIFCHQCTCELCGKGAHYGYNCPPKVLIIPDPEPFNNQTINELPRTLPSFDPTCYSEEGNSFTYDSKSNLVDDSPNIFNPPPQTPTYSYEFCGNDTYYGHDCSLQFLVIHQPIREKMCAKLLAEEQEANFNTQPFQYSVIPQPPQEEISVLSLAWETILEIELAFEDKHCQPEDILELFQRLHNDVQNIHEELAVYINTPSWDRPIICYNDDDDEDYTIVITPILSTEEPDNSLMYINTPSWDRPIICYNDDDDEDYTIVITPILSTEEPDNSLSMGDEHLDTILATKSDEFIKSNVENLVPVPSESEGIPDNMCDVPFHDNSLPLNVSKDQFKDFFDSNDDSTLINDDSFSIDDIEYVEASPPDSELIILEVMEIVIPKIGGIDDDILLTIKDDILREKLLNVNLLIANIEALKDNPTPSSDFMTKSSSTSLNFLLEETKTFDNSLLESESFCFNLEGISSGSTTTHSGISLPYYEVFYGDHVKEICSGDTTTHSDCSLYDSSDFYHEEFADELAHIIPPPEYDCFCFKNEPNSGDFTMDKVEDIFPTREPRVHVHNVLPSHPTLQLNLDFILSSESLFAYGVWIFLPFLSYSVAPKYLLSFENEDTILDPGISIYHISSFLPDVSHRSGTSI
nr:hypothetical protein [Tanacetum cinerariifolium]